MASLAIASLAIENYFMQLSMGWWVGVGVGRKDSKSNSFFIDFGGWTTIDFLPGLYSSSCLLWDVISDTVVALAAGTVQNGK